MDGARERLSDVLDSLDRRDGIDDSRATSPGVGVSRKHGVDHGSLTRDRPRTYPYFRYLPYKVEDGAQRQQNLDDILKHLYIAIEAGDFSPGALHWTRELRNWLGLKFDPTKEQRIRLSKLYYELSLAPGLDATASDRFSNMFMILTKYVQMCTPFPTTADRKPSQAEALSTAWRRHGLGLETPLQGVEGLCPAFRIRHGPYHKYEAEYSYTYQAVQFRPILLQPRSHTSDLGRSPAAFHYLLYRGCFCRDWTIQSHLPHRSACFRR